MGREQTACDRPVVSENAQDIYQRVLQALRDVRHMLPAEGVAIVDAVLDGPSFQAHAQSRRTLLFVLSPFAGDAEALNSAQEIEFLEANSLK